MLSYAQCKAKEDFILSGSCNRWRRISLVIHANVCVGSKAVQLDA